MAALINFKMAALINFKMAALINFKMAALINFKMAALINFKMAALINFKMAAPINFKMAARNQYSKWRLVAMATPYYHLINQVRVGVGVTGLLPWQPRLLIYFSPSDWLRALINMMNIFAYAFLLFSWQNCRHNFHVIFY